MISLRIGIPWDSSPSNPTFWEVIRLVHPLSISIEELQIQVEESQDDEKQ